MPSESALSPSRKVTTTDARSVALGDQSYVEISKAADSALPPTSPSIVELEDPTTEEGPPESELAKTRCRFRVGWAARSLVLALFLVGVIGIASFSTGSGLHDAKLEAVSETFGCWKGPRPKDFPGPNTKGDPQEFKVLSYNLEWWKLFKLEHGSGGRATRLIESTGPYDIMGFQECDDPGWALSSPGLTGKYSFSKTSTTGNGGSGLCTAWATAKLKMMKHGTRFVAEDARIKGQYYGKRAAQWTRLRHYESGKFIFFVNHHGPLPVGSGGACGGLTTARNLLRLVNEKSQPGDIIIIVGDFNAANGDATIDELSWHLHHVFNGKAFKGVDNIFTNAKAHSQTNLGSGGSDHGALSIVIHVDGTSTPPTKPKDCPQEFKVRL